MTKSAIHGILFIEVFIVVLVSMSIAKKERQQMYTVKLTEDQLWTVGEVSSNGEFDPVSDHGSKQEAEDEATRLNGGTPERDYKKLYDTVYALLDRIDEQNQKIDELNKKFDEMFQAAQHWQAAASYEVYKNMKLAEENLELSTLE